MLDKSVVPMPSTVAAQLQEPLGSPCLRLEYRALDAGHVLGLCTNYLRFPEAAAVNDAPFHSYWYDLLDAARLTVGSSDLLIEAVLADDEDLAAQLDVDLNAPLVAVQQVIRDETGRPYDFALLRFRADRFSIMARAIPPFTPGVPA